MITGLQCSVQRLALAQLLTDTLAGDDIGVNTHAHGEDDTRNAGDRQRAAGHEAEPARNCCQHAGNLSDQGDGSNHTQQAVQNDHVDDDACQRDDASDDHGVQRTLAHGREMVLKLVVSSENGSAPALILSASSLALS